MYVCIRRSDSTIVVGAGTHNDILYKASCLLDRPHWDFHCIFPIYLHLASFTNTSARVMRVLQFHEAFKLVGGQLVFSRMKGIVEDDGTKYLASWRQRGPPKNLAFDDLIEPKPLQTEDRGPEIQKSWKKADTTSECYIKVPKLEDYADSELEQRMLREIEVCERVLADAKARSDVG